MMKLSDELVQGFALGEAALSEHAEEVIRTVVMEEDEAWVGPERSVKSRFLELLEQHPELTRPQAYMQAMMEITEPAIKATYRGYAVSPELAPGVLARLEENDNATRRL